MWTGDEQKSFKAVIAGFEKKYPKVTVKYNSAGDNVPTVLSTAVEGGNPPELATIAQPGLIKDFQKKGAIKPIDFARSDVEGNYPADIAKLGTIGGKLYSFVFKAANKSTVWFNVKSFQDAGVEPPQNWDDFLTAAKTLKASGTPAYSIGGADGWTLTDLFENIYLRQAGPEKYDQLAEHKIKWTDPSVKDALKAMAQVVGDTKNIAGGKSARSAPTSRRRCPTCSRPRRRRRWSSRATSSRASWRPRRSSRPRPATTCSRSRRSATPPTPWSAAATRWSCSRTRRRRARS